MRLRCSVLGHRYGEREHVEERDRQGSEEVITVREVKTCERCGEELVVTESKEVLAVDGTGDAGEGAEPEAAASIREAEPEPDVTEAPAETDEPVDSVDEDDGIILPDEPEDREPGEWPPVEVEDAAEPGFEGEAEWPDREAEEVTAEAETEAAPEPWPESDQEDEGFDATAGDDAELAGQVVEATGGASEESVERTDAGFYRASPMDAPADPDRGEVHTEFFCPNCDWSARSLTTSVRRGDICPECRKGYVSERAA